MQKIVHRELNHSFKRRLLSLLKIKEKQKNRFHLVYKAVEVKKKKISILRRKRRGNCCNPLPIRARRLTQLGIGLPVSRTQASLQKWLQFFLIRWYAFPLYSSASSSITALTWAGPMLVFPIKILFLNVNPHCFGSPSKIPVVGYSWAPNAYSTPWTASWGPQAIYPEKNRTPGRITSSNETPTSDESRYTISSPYQSTSKQFQTWKT